MKLYYLNNKMDELKDYLPDTLNKIISEYSIETSIDNELKQLRDTFVYFTERALEYDKVVDPRIVMVHVLKKLIDSDGTETPSTIKDTHPREGILDAIHNDINDREIDEQQLSERLYNDFNGELNTNETIWFDLIAKDFIDKNNIPITRMFENKNYSKLLRFLQDFRDKYYDTITTINPFEHDNEYERVLKELFE